MYEAGETRRKLRHEIIFWTLSIKNPSFERQKSHGGHCVCKVKKKLFRQFVSWYLKLPLPAINVTWIVIRTALHDSVQSEVSICKTGQKTSVFRR